MQYTHSQVVTITLCTKPRLSQGEMQQLHYATASHEETITYCISMRDYNYDVGK